MELSKTASSFFPSSRPSTRPTSPSPCGLKAPVTSSPLRSTVSLSSSAEGALTRTSASPPLTQLGWLESTARSTVFACAAPGLNAIAATANAKATSFTLNFLGTPCLLGETKYGIPSSLDLN